MTKDDDYEELNDSNIIELKIEREERSYEDRVRAI